MLRLSETRKDKWATGQRAKPRDELDELNQFFDDVKGMKYEGSDEGEEVHKNERKRSKKRDSREDDISSMSEIEDDLPTRKANKKARPGTTTYRPISDRDPIPPTPGHLQHPQESWPNAAPSKGAPKSACAQ